jgi:hypothetical protein
MLVKSGSQKDLCPKGHCLAVRNQQVVGSNPTGGSRESNKCKVFEVHLGGHSVDLSRIVRELSELSSSRLSLIPTRTVGSQIGACDSFGSDGKMELNGVGYALGAATLFGASTPAAKLLLRYLSPLMLSTFLYLGATTALSDYRLLAFESREAQIARRDLPPVCGIIFFGGMLGMAA